jgi:hypothetical protein
MKTRSTRHPVWTSIIAFAVASAIIRILHIGQWVCVLAWAPDILAPIDCSWSGYLWVTATSTVVTSGIFRPIADLKHSIEMETIRALEDVSIAPVALAEAAAVFRVRKVQCELSVFGRALNI